MIRLTRGAANVIFWVVLAIVVGGVAWLLLLVSPILLGAFLGPMVALGALAGWWLRTWTWDRGGSRHRSRREVNR